MRRAQEREIKHTDLNRRIRAVGMPLSLKNENCSGYDRGVLPFAIRPRSCSREIFPLERRSGIKSEDLELKTEDLE